jgi:hypothetical protein
MNKNGRKASKAQLRENERCLKDFQKGKLASMTFDDCTTADRKFKVDAAKGKTREREGKKCHSLDESPPFAYTSAATVNLAAEDGALALTYKIFGGPPVLDANLVTKADNKDAAKCQHEMLKRANKVENTVLKEINKAKRQALKDETVDSAAALEAKLRVVLSSNEKISRAEGKLMKSVDKKCDGLEAPDTIFLGSCGQGNPNNLSGVEDCVVAAARCEACVKINAFDALKLNCDEADDQITNRSCP